MKKLLVLVVALAVVLLFAAPAFATPQTSCVWDQDASLEFSLPINLQVENALWAEFQEGPGEGQGAQKDSLDLGPVCPEEEACDDGVLVVKSNDDFYKTFTWTNLEWQAIGEDSFEGPFPAINAADLDVTVDGSPVTSGFATYELMGEQSEAIELCYTPDWTHHAGTYAGTMLVSILQE